MGWEVEAYFNSEGKEQKSINGIKIVGNPMSGDIGLLITLTEMQVCQNPQEEHENHRNGHARNPTGARNEDHQFNDNIL
jgi:hypothetical protein